MTEFQIKIRKQNTKYENVLENDQLSSRLNSYICPGWIICDRDKEQWFRDVFNGKVNPTKCQNSVRERVWCVRLFGPFEFELPAALPCVYMASRSRQKSSMPPTTAENGRHSSAKRRRRGKRRACASDREMSTCTGRHLSFPLGFLVYRRTDGDGGGK